MVQYCSWLGTTELAIFLSYLHKLVKLMKLIVHQGPGVLLNNLGY